MDGNRSKGGRHLYASLDNTNKEPTTKSNEQDHFNHSNIFYLMLSATRLILIWHLSQPTSQEIDSYYKDPYQSIMYQYCVSKVVKEYLFQKLYIAQHQISTMLTCIQSLQEQGRVFLPLETECLAISKQFLSKLESHENVESLLSTNNSLKHCWLLKEASSNCAQSISMYRISDQKYQQCSEWCDVLLSTVSLYAKDDATTTTPTNLNVVISEITAIKAHAMIMSQQFAVGLHSARESWKKSMLNPKVNSLILFFHCAVAYKTKGRGVEEKGDVNPNNNKKLSSLSYEALLELDSAISYLL
jgi:hypothetical protein